ncbi:hypothetical protein [Enterovibrio sp. 27052020O]|uniref:hypothetical protein n=1 Tax=Enterovibrio sp. 27052020O TaxID=3241166 RepID=UPI00388D57E2
MNQDIGRKTLSGLSFLFSKLPKTEKWLHIVVMSWVIFQIATSFEMHVHADTTHSQIALIDDIHIYGGLILLLVSMVFFVLVINRRHFSDLYPWAYGQFDTIKQDIRALLKWKLPEAHPGGLAATVEGLGLLALLLALFTGSWWFILFSKGSTLAPDFLSMHKTAVGAIEAYVYGHGLFALLHLLTWWRR